MCLLQTLLSSILAFKWTKKVVFFCFVVLTLISASSTNLNFNTQQLNRTAGPVSWGMNHYVYETMEQLGDDESYLIPSSVEIPSVYFVKTDGEIQNDCCVVAMQVSE